MQHVSSYITLSDEVQAALQAQRPVVSLESIPTTTARTASFVQGSKTGISFSHSRPVYAFGSGQDVEPNARVEPSETFELPYTSGGDWRGLRGVVRAYV